MQPLSRRSARSTRSRRLPRQQGRPSIAKHLVATLLLALLLPSSGSADTETPSGSEERVARYKNRPNTRELGPFYITPKITATAGWDTNVNNSQDDPFRDSTFGMVGSLEVFLPAGRRIGLTGTGTLVPNYFTSVESARSLDRSGALRAELDVGPLTLFGGVGVGRAKQRFSTEIDDRLWRNEDSGSLGALLSLTSKLRLSGSWTRRDYEYDEGVLVGGKDVSQALNRTSTIRRYGMGFALTKRTRLLARAEVIDDRFVGTSDAPLDDEIRSYRFLGGLGFTAFSDFQGEVLAGWRRYPSGRSAPEYSGPTLEVRLLVPMIGNGLTLVAARDVYYAVEPAPGSEGSGARRNSLVSGRYAATIGFDLPFELLARATGQLWRSAYLLPYEQDGVTYDRVDDVWTAGAAVLRRFGRRVAIGGTIERSWRRTNANSRDYAATRYGLTAEIYP